MRCLVTGAKGLLGTYLCEFLRREQADVVEWDLPRHDITDIEKTINGIHVARPEVIFHCAAWTDVDGCEQDPAKATSINSQGAWAVALGAGELGCKMVHISTDYVFDGTSKRPWREDDKTNPLSVYGRSKLRGEKAVERSAKKRFIARTSWLYGAHGRNFVDTIRKLAAEKPRIEVVTDQVGSPTFARDLCRALWDLARSEKYGTYHLTNGGNCSWFELAQEVVRLAGLKCEVAPTDSKIYVRPAPRPAYSVLDNGRFRKRFGNVLRPWQEALADYLGARQTRDQKPETKDQKEE